ncbi:uncharacterized protein LOC142591148 isoform X2 [Dermacentor variabilis]|uniref:uncharacterized protein LOC142591148 isoform X2 n=1 Tax=Dermacentor variabilis TaxID=34621 RepID=UPI003F5C3D09
MSQEVTDGKSSTLGPQELYGAMRWEICTMVLVMTCKQFSLAKCSACGENEQKVYCKRYPFVRQRMCPKVTLWPCSIGSLSCGCHKNLLRSSDGICVPENKCDPAKRKPKRPSFQFPPGTHIPGGTLKFLQSNQTIVLVLMSQIPWFQMGCFCMESTLIEYIPPRNVVRAVSCKYPVKMNKVQLGFELKMSDEATYIDLSLNRPGLQGLPFGFPGRFVVLYANGVCFVLKYSGNTESQVICSLWGLKNAKDEDEQVCFLTIARLCPGPTIDAYQENRDRCELHDDLVQQALNKNND